MGFYIAADRVIPLKKLREAFRVTSEWKKDVNIPSYKSL